MSLGHSLSRDAARDLRRDGEPVTLRQQLQDSQPAPQSTTWDAQAAPVPVYQDALSRGAVRGWRPDQIVADAYQGDIEVRLSPVLLAGAGWSEAPRRDMQLLVRGHTFTIQGCDTRALGDVAVLHIVQARGGR